MASPLRFRHSTRSWTTDAVESGIYQPLDSTIGATITRPWFKAPDGFEARRFDMDNGDLALFAWNDREGYWVGNTETPKTLWRTEKISLDGAPSDISQWAQRELLATLHERDPWLEQYPHISWFFLPVFLSKDGRDSSRWFFSEHSAGFPEADRESALTFYEEFLKSGVLDPYREVMAGKIGTSEEREPDRMTAAMGEFNAAYLLASNGYEIEPEASVTTGHSIDFRVSGDGGTTLVEVTRPAPVSRRNADSPIEAIKSTVETKTNGQLEAHAGGVVLLVDCSSFSESAFDTLQSNRIEVGHRPAVIYLLDTEGTTTGYSLGTIGLDLSGID
ncbi:MAG: DUF5784 family protein [Halodesulfurarchaeum sp.]